MASEFVAVERADAERAARILAEHERICASNRDLPCDCDLVGPDIAQRFRAVLSAGAQRTWHCAFCMVGDYARPSDEECPGISLPVPAEGERACAENHDGPGYCEKCSAHLRAICPNCRHDHGWCSTPRPAAQPDVGVVRAYVAMYYCPLNGGVPQTPTEHGMIRAGVSLILGYLSLHPPVRRKRK